MTGEATFEGKQSPKQSVVYKEQDDQDEVYVHGSKVLSAECSIICDECLLSTTANKSKVYYGIPPEPDLGVVIEEENEEEDDKDKPKVL